MITIDNNRERSSYLMNGTITVRFYSKITTIINTAKQWKLTQAGKLVRA